MGDVVLEARSILERFKLDGRTALVTGGGQGIGRAIAHALAEAGANVAIVDINLQTAETVAHELTEKGVEAMAIACDVTKSDDVNSMVKAIVDKWGKLTIGINNAGIGFWHDAETMKEEEWDRTMDVNLKGVFLCCQAEARAMLKAGYGKIINTASMSGTIVNMPQHQSAYNISKAGVIHMTKSLAAEWAERGVRVNCISPGYTRTQLVTDLLQTEVGQTVSPEWMSRTPINRMADVTELQGLVVYLSGETSDFMTGSDLIIDGGYTTW